MTSLMATSAFGIRCKISRRWYYLHHLCTP